MEKYWNEAVSYSTYKADALERIARPKSEEEKEKRHYYQLGIQRMNRMEKVFRPSEVDEETLIRKNFNGKVLIISEVWCGDASQAIPVIYALFKNKNEVRIIYRDQNEELMNQFLTDGSQSIPKILLLNDDFSVKKTWGPRPAHGAELLKEFKENPDTYEREEFYNDLQVYYAKNRGRDTVDEILNLL